MIVGLEEPTTIDYRNGGSWDFIPCNICIPANSVGKKKKDLMNGEKLIHKMVKKFKNISLNNDQ